MKNPIKSFKPVSITAIIALIAITGLGMAACGDPDNGGSDNFSTPSSPEAMSGKTALKFFTDNDIKAGWNLGNTLDAVTFSGNTAVKAEETAWGNPLASQQLFNGVVQSGFDIVRIPCTWLGHIGPAPDYKVSEARLKRVAVIVGYAKTAGAKAVVINIHHDGNNTSGDNSIWGFVDLPAAVNNSAKKSEIQNQIGKVWTQIAEYFKNYGDYLIFETLNEVHNGNWGYNAPEKEQDILFDWNQAALSAIRATGGNNAERFVAVPGLGGTEPGVVIAAHSRGKLLPNDGANGNNKLIVSVHYYDPGQYTVAAANDPSWPLIHTWGSSSEKEHLSHEAGLVKTNFIDKGIAVYFGEWGAPTNVRSSMSAEIKNTHIDYIKSVAGAARANGVVPIYWDDGGDFKMLERSNGKPKTGLWADVLSAMITAINNAAPSVTVTPNPITGNLGNYRFGLKEDGITENNTQAVWELKSGNLSNAKVSGAKLELVLKAAPDAGLQFIWQGPDNGIWWQQTVPDILDDNGNINNSSHASWDAGAKTLTINMSAAKNYDSEGDGSGTFTSQNSLNIIVAYYGGNSVNDLGIVSANLVTE